MLKAGKLNEKYVDVEVMDRNIPIVEIFSASGMEEMDINIKEMFGGLFPKKKKQRKVKVPEALTLLTQEEAQKLIDMDSVIRQAIDRVEQSGIIFIDEIDKVAGRETSYGPDVSREGVQRDILPIVEGTTVTTKYGMVKNGPYSLHRCRGLPRVETVRPDPGAPGPVSHTGGARVVGQGGIHPHSHGA